MPCAMSARGYFPTDAIRRTARRSLSRGDRRGRCAAAATVIVFPQEGGQLEGFQVMGQQELRRIAHDAAPVSSPIYERAEVVATSARGK